MKYIKGIYVDAKDGIPASRAPLRNGPELPHPNLEVTLVDRRNAPEPAIILGTLPDADTINEDAMEEITQTEYDGLVNDYQTWWDETQARHLQEKREGMVISRFQAKTILRQKELLPQVEELLNNPDVDPFLLDAWEEASEFRRISPTLTAVCQQLGLSEEEIDELFEEASQIIA